MKNRYKAALATVGVGALLTGGAFALAPGASATTYTYYYAQSSGQSVAANGGNSDQVTVFCNTGDSVTGGGLIVNSTSASDYNDVEISQSFPTLSGSTGGWIASATNEEAAARTVYVYAMCAHAL